MVKVSEEENRHVRRKKLASSFVIYIKACDDGCLCLHLQTL